MACACTLRVIGTVLSLPVSVPSPVHKALMAPATAPRQNALARISLATLAARVTGAGLDKAQQCSAWGARPLSAAQTAYAAADAACLVDIFDRLLYRCPDARPARPGSSLAACVIECVGGVAMC